MIFGTHSILDRNFQLFSTHNGLKRQLHLAEIDDKGAIKFSTPITEFRLQNFDTPAEVQPDGNLKFRCQLAGLLVTVPGLSKAEKGLSAPGPMDDKVTPSFEVDVVMSSQMLKKVRCGTGRPGTIRIRNFHLPFWSDHAAISLLRSPVDRAVNPAMQVPVKFSRSFQV
jgi:hypothetical protein